VTLGPHRRPPPWLALLPRGLRGRVYYRLFSADAPRHPALFQDAELAFARGTRMVLRPGDISHGEIAFTGVYELEQSRGLARLARRGGTLCDVGANYGYYTCLWAAQRPGNRVVAYEASAANYEALGRNVARNGFQDRVRAFACAAGRDAGRAAFYAVPGADSGWGGFAARTGGIRGDVEVVRLDDHLASLDVRAVDALKIDVEGADAWVLAGCERMLSERRIGHVWYEENRPCMTALGIAPGESRRLLERWGYHVRALTDPRQEVATYTASVRGR